MNEPTQIEQLNACVDQLDALLLDQEELAASLEAVKARINLYQSSLIPELMHSLGFEKLTTSAGLQVELRQEVRASFPKDPERRDAALAWLKESGNDGLIKREFRLRFGRDAEERVSKLRELFTQNDVYNQCDVDEEWTVHHQTLLKFLRDSLAAGTEVPFEAFNAFVQQIAKIKR